MVINGKIGSGRGVFHSNVPEELTVAVRLVTFMFNIRV
jgi:hypothetical protein